MILFMENRGPWKVKEIISKYKNQWLELNEYQVIRPDGKEGIFGVVKIVPGSGVIPMDDEGNVYLTKEFRFAVNRDSFETAGGVIDPGESPLTAAKRELKEELGITADEWINMGKFDPFTSVINCPAHLFFARKLKFSETELEGTEEIEMVKVSFLEAVNMVFDGRITHGATCLLIMKIKEFLSNT
jgi:8-oxo-dGTP pyrophosphatase MutT (NUDIX family)